MKQPSKIADIVTFGQFSSAIPSKRFRLVDAIISIIKPDNRRSSVFAVMLD